MEVIKAVEFKARWTDMEEKDREERGQTTEEALEEERKNTQVYNKQEGILKLANMRVTDLPTNKEVILPDERPNKVEVGLQSFGAEIMEVARKYIKENVDSSGNVKVSNLSQKQEAGLKDIETMVKNKHIVTKTDKSGRQCLLTEDEYIATGLPHVVGDEVKTRKEVEKSEDILNSHATHFARLVGLCDGQDCARRLKSALLNQNTLPPCLYLTIKDHKPMTPGEPLPARGVCGAKRAPNGQLGFILVQVLDAVSDKISKSQGTECSSTEDMLANIEEKINQK